MVQSGAVDVSPCETVMGAADDAALDMVDKHCVGFRPD